MPWNSITQKNTHQNNCELVMNIYQINNINSQYIINRLHVLSFQLLVITIPFYQKISSFFLILFLLFGLGKLIFGNTKIRVNISYILPPLLFLSYFIPYLYFGFDGISLLENRLTLLVVPVAFLTIDFSKIPVEKVLTLFILGTTVALIACYIFAFYSSFELIDGEVFFDARISREFTFLESSIMDGNRLFGDMFSIFHQSTYFGYYINLSLAAVLAFSLWKKNRLYRILPFLFLLALFQLSSKINIVIFLALIGFYGIFEIKSMYYRIGVILILGLVSATFFMVNPRGKQLIDQFKTNQFSINSTEKYGYNLRFMSWSSSIELVRARPIKGYGLNKAQESLDSKYLEYHYTRAYDKHYNSHNQFLQIYLENGLFSVLTLIVMFVVLFKHGRFTLKKGQYIYMFSIIMLLAFLFESALNRYSGMIIFILFFVYLTNSKLELSTNNNNL